MSRIMITEDTLLDEHESDESNESINESAADDVSIKEQILLVIAALKDSVMQELDYFKVRTGYSINMIVKGSIFFFIAFIFVLAAFILLGIGLLLALKSAMGIIWATILSLVIFLTLSLIMALIGKNYFKKLSFPELNDAQFITEDNDEL